MTQILQLYIYEEFISMVWNSEYNCGLEDGSPFPWAIPGCFETPSSFSWPFPDLMGAMVHLDLYIDIFCLLTWFTMIWQVINVKCAWVRGGKVSMVKRISYLQSVVTDQKFYLHHVGTVPNFNLHNGGTLKMSNFNYTISFIVYIPKYTITFCKQNHFVMELSIMVSPPHP